MIMLTQNKTNQYHTISIHRSPNKNINICSFIHLPITKISCYWFSCVLHVHHLVHVSIGISKKNTYRQDTRIYPPYIDNRQYPQELGQYSYWKMNIVNIIHSLVAIAIAFYCFNIFVPVHDLNLMLCLYCNCCSYS